MARRDIARYEMFVRVRTFGSDHRDRFPEGSKGGQLFDCVATAVTQFQTGNTTRFKVAQAGRRTKQAAKRALFRQLQDIACAARVVSRPGFGHHVRLRVPGNVSDHDVLLHAQVSINAGRSMSAQLLELGFAADWDMRLEATTAAFEAALQERRLASAAIHQANAEWKVASANAMDAIHTLDVIVRNTLREDAAAMGDWRRARAR